MSGTADELLRILEESVAECVRGRDNVGLVYSSGIDSALVGLLASRHASVRAYNVGFEDSADRGYARDVAGEMPFKVSFIKLTDEEVEEALPAVLRSVGEPNPLKLSVAIPFYFASRKARSDGLSFMLCGQGADELFGGYSRYIQVLDEGGYEGLSSALERDVKELYAAQLQYDDRVCRENGVELGFPFMGEDFVRFVSGVGAELKVKLVEGEPEYECVDEAEGKRFIRKFILREAAKIAGLPEPVLNRRKKAAQYGSGTNKAIDRIARKRGFVKRARAEGRKDYLRFFVESLWDEISEEGKKGA